METGYLVVLSGGQDSTSVLASVIDHVDYAHIRVVTFDYAQRHDVEIEAALDITSKVGLSAQHEIIDITGGVLLGTSPLVNRSAHVDTYPDAKSLPGGLEKTFVPMRNALFLTLAANRAMVHFDKMHYKTAKILTGVSQEDYGGYPDCRELFIRTLETAFRASLDDPELPALVIEAPLLHLSKADTVRYAQETKLGLDLMAYTHTCYNGSVPPCGHCHACLLRAKGFAEVGIEDPLVKRLAHYVTTGL